jgi:uncharacterized protein YeaO (DUF488 family)
MRRLFACHLRAAGYTVNPDEATLMLERSGPAWMGKHAPSHPIRKQAAEESMDFLKQFMPELAEQMAQAKTDQEKAALGALMLQRHKAAATEAEDMASRVKPEDFE